MMIIKKEIVFYYDADILKDFSQRLKEDVFPKFNIVYLPIITKIIMMLEDINTVFEYSGVDSYKLSFITLIENKEMACEIQFLLVNKKSARLGVWIRDTKRKNVLVIYFNMHKAIDQFGRDIFQSRIFDDSTFPLHHFQIEFHYQTLEKKITAI